MQFLLDLDSLDYLQRFYLNLDFFLSQPYLDMLIDLMVWRKLQYFFFLENLKSLRWLVVQKEYQVFLLLQMLEIKMIVPEIA
jgi:hypothetical protein